MMWRWRLAVMVGWTVGWIVAGLATPAAAEPPHRRLKACSCAPVCTWSSSSGSSRASSRRKTTCRTSGRPRPGRCRGVRRQVSGTASSNRICSWSAGRRRPVDAVPRRVRGGRPAGARSQRAADEAVRLAFLVHGEPGGADRPGKLAVQHRQPAADRQRAGARAGDSRPGASTALQVQADRARANRSVRRGASATAVWVIEYQEVEKQTMIRTTNGRDLPSRGRFWIEPATGRRCSRAS